MPAKSRQNRANDDGCSTGVGLNQNEDVAACYGYCLESCQNINALDPQQKFSTMQAGDCRNVSVHHCLMKCCKDMNGNVKAQCRQPGCEECSESPHRKRNRRRARYKSNRKIRKTEGGHFGCSHMHSQQDSVSTNFKRQPEDADLTQLEQDVSLSYSAIEPVVLIVPVYCAILLHDHNKMLYSYVGQPSITELIYISWTGV